MFSWQRCIVLLTTLIASTAVARAQSVGFPELPATPYDYVEYAVDNLPTHFGDGGFLTATSGDNTPDDNPITNEGATLGRVLFYDKRLSHDNSLACASCHHQELGFSDDTRFSQGIDGATTERHSMSLTNTKFYANDRFFRDESADSLEEQVIIPILNPIELGSEMDELLIELAQTDYYAELFQNAFGSPEVTRDGISNAMAQFVRSMVSYQSKYDSAFDENGDSDFDRVLTEQENLGRKLFHGAGRCSFCHTSEAQVATQPHNTGLDAVTVDAGAGNASFKSASLRNVGAREFFMHDGRFSSLAEVVDFYSDEIEPHPDLDFRLRDTAKDNEPLKLDFSDEEKDALVAFLETLTDYEFLNDPKFSNPFILPCDFDHDENCTVSDLNLMLAAGNIAEGVEVDEASGFSQFDLNGDATIDQQDIGAWLQISATANSVASYPLGDANLDGLVDETDFTTLSANLFKEANAWDAGDFNGDGLVDGTDFNIWITSAADQRESLDAGTTVPEPAGGFHLVYLLVSAAMIRRRAAWLHNTP